jgi:prophage DNA circulation protein
MYSQRAMERIAVINKKISFIENIVRNKGTIIKALEDEENSRASILMHLTSIAEQFDKLLHSGELEILANFEK